MTRKEDAAAVEDLRNRIDECFQSLGMRPDQSLEIRSRLAFFGNDGGYAVFDALETIVRKLKELEAR